MVESSVSCLMVINTEVVRISTTNFIQFLFRRFVVFCEVIAISFFGKSLT